LVDGAGGIKAHPIAALVETAGSKLLAGNSVEVNLATRYCGKYLGIGDLDEADFVDCEIYCAEGHLVSLMVLA
jgi:hypothetical protein